MSSFFFKLCDEDLIFRIRWASLPFPTGNGLPNNPIVWLKC